MRTSAQKFSTLYARIEKEIFREIDRAVRTVTKRADFELYGSGRTDAGVHEIGRASCRERVYVLV